MFGSPSWPRCASVVRGLCLGCAGRDAARRAGVQETVIDLLRAREDPASLLEDARDIVVRTRQLIRSNRVGQAVFDLLFQPAWRTWLG